jgi:hypothetical protein
MPPTIKPDCTTTASRPTVTRLEANVTHIITPAGCCASVLLKFVDRDPEKRVSYDAWWVVVGRYHAGAVSVPYTLSHDDTLRFDVPVGTLLSTDYLQEYLTEFWCHDHHRPGDTVIIKG